MSNIRLIKLIPNTYAKTTRMKRFIKSQSQTYRTSTSTPNAKTSSEILTDLLQLSSKPIYRKPKCMRPSYTFISFPHKERYHQQLHRPISSQPLPSSVHVSITIYILNNESMSLASNKLKYHHQFNISKWNVPAACSNASSNPSQNPERPRHRDLSCPGKRTTCWCQSRRREKGRSEGERNGKWTATTGLVWVYGLAPRYPVTVCTSCSRALPHRTFSPLPFSPAASLSPGLPAETLAPPAIVHGTGVRPHYACCTATSRTSGDIIICKLHLILVELSILRA